MIAIKFCPFCEKTGTVKIITRPDKTRFCKCSNCGEEFIPGGMMIENHKILMELRRLSKAGDKQLLREVKTYQSDRSPIIEDIQRCIDIAKEHDCVVRLEWHIKWSGHYHIYINSKSNAEDIYVHEVPKSYSV